MLKSLKEAVLVLALLTLITGVAYPLAVTGIAQLLFPEKADGSLIFKDGKPVGSGLLGQQFENPKYFWGRPSATTPMPYNTGSSSGSNLSQDNPVQIKAVQERAARLRAADPDNKLPIPVDLVTASGSGLDPHISPAAAEYQIKRVAKARGMDESKIRELVAANTEKRTFGILGEPRVNVLKLNLALDEFKMNGNK